MVIKEALLYGTSLLSEASDSPALDSKLLLGKVLNCDTLFLMAHREDIIGGDDFTSYKSLLERRLQKEPVAYILGEKEFMSLSFKVNKHTLIPRPDTEILVEYGIKNFKGRVLDIGTGSGAISVSLAKFGKGLSVSAVDISLEALNVAKENAQRNNVSVDFFLLDILNQEIPYKYDAIVSNPPYIESHIIENLDEDVKDFEPRIALDGGNDGLDFYRVITKKAKDALNDKGILAFEIGYDQGESVFQIINEHFCQIKLLKDLSGNDRVLVGIKK